MLTIAAVIISEVVAYRTQWQKEIADVIERISTNYIAT